MAATHNTQERERERAREREVPHRQINTLQLKCVCVSGIYFELTRLYCALHCAEFIMSSIFMVVYFHLSLLLQFGHKIGWIEVQMRKSIWAIV